MKLITKLIWGFIAVVAAVQFCPVKAEATKVDIVEYACRVCDKLFYSFKGDDLERGDLEKEDDQLSKVYQLAERGKNFEPCKGGFKYHIFDKKREGPAPMEFIFKNASRVAVIKGGPNVNGALKEWRCFMCGKPFYSLNQDDLNIKRWDEQKLYIFNLRGQSISKCKPEYYGHVFELKKSGSFTSSELANVVPNLHWIKQ